MGKIKTFGDARDAASEVYERLLARSINVDQAGQMRASVADWTRAAIAEIGARRERRACDEPADKKALNTMIGDKASQPPTITQPKTKKQLPPGGK